MERKETADTGGAGIRNRDLLEACSRGDERALLIFYERYRNLIYNAIHSWMNAHLKDGEVDRSEEVSELFQEAFLTLMKDDFARLRRARDPDRFTGLLFLIVYQMTGRHFRRRWVEEKRKSDRTGSDIGVLDDHLDRLSREEQAELVGDFLRGLAPIDRQILELSYDRGLRYREIAGELGLTTTNVGVKISRLKNRLRTYLSDRLGSEADGL